MWGSTGMLTNATNKNQLKTVGDVASERTTGFVDTTFITI